MTKTTMAPKTQMSSSFVLDPKGGCFLCLKEIPNSLQNISVLLPESNNSSILSFKLLARHLKLDVGKVLGTITALDGASSPLLDPIIGNEVAVPLCTGCVDLTGKFSELYRRLDRLRLEVDAAVLNIRGVMVEADQDKELVFQYRQRVLAEESASLGDGILRALSDSLRKEVLQKCSSAAKRTPRVKLRQLPTYYLKAEDHHHLRNDNTDIRRIAEAEINDFQRNIKKSKIEPSKELLKTGTEVQPHNKLAHHRARKSIQCNFCSGGQGSKRFRNSAHLWYHKATQHRTKLFLQYRDPKLPFEQFEDVLAKLFQDLHVPSAGNYKFSCIFCNSVSSQGKIGVENHIIRKHMEELVPRLMGLQLQQQLLQQTTQDDDESIGDEVPKKQKSSFSKRLAGPACRPALAGKRCFNKSISTTKLTSYATANYDQIAFLKLLDDTTGRYQCSVCSKIVQKCSIPSHKLCHLEVKSFQCNLCPQAFRHPKCLREHKLSRHRSTFFAQYKDPSLTSWEFETLLVSLFKGIQVPKIRNREFKCSFCDCGSMCDLRRVRNHLIRYHMDELVPRLLELQKNHVSGGNISSSDQVGGGRREDQHQTSNTAVADLSRVGGDDDCHREETKGSFICTAASPSHLISTPGFLLHQPQPPQELVPIKYEFSQSAESATVTNDSPFMIMSLRRELHVVDVADNTDMELELDPDFVVKIDPCHEGIEEEEEEEEGNADDAEEEKEECNNNPLVVGGDDASMILGF